MTQSENRAEDPFFRRSEDTVWNACIGPQGHEENYVDGYIEAAVLLADLVVEKELYISRDTLVLPILYNARHAIELSLKYAIKRLYATGVLLEDAKANHDITKHLEKINRARIGDYALRELVKRIEPYVQSLSAIDADGQQLRYSRDQEGNRSLENRPLANLNVIRGGLAELSRILQKLKNRIHSFCEENSTGTKTAICSRSDLEYIARELSVVKDRRSPAFVELKARIKERFGLGNKTFDDAVAVIETNPELAVYVGVESELKYLSDEKAKFFAENWTKLHPARPAERKGRIIPSSELRDIIMAMPSSAPIARDLMRELSIDELADVETIYYLGRDNEMPEFYSKLLSSTKREYEVDSNSIGKVQNLLSKTNFLTVFAKGLTRLGRPKLAEEILATKADPL